MCTFLKATNNKGADQTARMRRLISDSDQTARNSRSLISDFVIRKTLYGESTFLRDILFRSQSGDFISIFNLSH